MFDMTKEKDSTPLGQILNLVIDEFH